MNNGVHGIKWKEYFSKNKSYITSVYSSTVIHSFNDARNYLCAWELHDMVSLLY